MDSKINEKKSENVTKEQKGDNSLAASILLRMFQASENQKK